MNKENNILRCKSKLRYFLKTESKLAMFPYDYKLVFQDSFARDIKDKWYISHSWGNFHPKHLYQHYNTNWDCAYVNKRKELVLTTRYNPLHVIKSELKNHQLNNPNVQALPDEFIIPNEIGLVQTKQEWKYGWFEIVAKLPKGKFLWPAFWLSSREKWPPEIDVFEAYSTELGNSYHKRWLLKKRKDWNIQPNLHWGVEGEESRDHWKGRSYPIRKCTDDFIEYAVHWEKDFIKIYYAGHLILDVRDKKILDWFDSPMHIILNNGVNKSFDPVENTSLIIKHVNVYQKRK